MIMNRSLPSLLILTLMMLFLPIQAQELTIMSMEEAPTDLSASTYQRLDNTGKPCALVKVRLVAEGAAFSGNVLGEVKNHEGEYWVYMSEGSYMLQVRHPKFQVLDVNFRHFGIGRVQSKATYILTLWAGEKLQKLIIDYTPKDAMVLVDSKPYQENGHVELFLPLGSHDYVIAKKGYTTIDGVAKLYEGNPRRIVEALQPEKHLETSQTSMKQNPVSQPDSHEVEQPVTPIKKQPVKGSLSQENEISIQTTYTVNSRKETIFGITRRYGITVEELIEANPEMKEPYYQLKKGAVLKIPVSRGGNNFMNLKMGESGFDESFINLIQLAVQENAEAEYRMGQGYETGQGGNFSKDLTAAQYWYTKARQHGSVEATDAIKRIGEIPSDKILVWGLITDEEGIPIIGTSIKGPQSSGSVISDYNGMFVLPIPKSGQDSIGIYCIGYYNQLFFIDKNSNKPLIIKLIEDIELFKAKEK